MKPTHSSSDSVSTNDSPRPHKLSIKDLVNDYDEDVFIYNLKNENSFSISSTKDENTFECKWGTCTKKYSDFDDFIVHVNSHLVHKPWKCEWREYFLFFYFFLFFSLYQ